MSYFNDLWDDVRGKNLPGRSHEDKQHYRAITASLCVAGSIACGLAGGFFVAGSVVLLGIAVWKLKIMLTDQ